MVAKRIANTPRWRSPVRAVYTTKAEEAMRAAATKRKVKTSAILATARGGVSLGRSPRSGSVGPVGTPRYFPAVFWAGELSAFFSEDPEEEPDFSAGLSALSDDPLLTGASLGPFLL